MSVMQIYQVDSSQLRTVDWTIDGKGKSLVKFGNVSKCFMSCIMCAAAHEKFSSQAGMSEAHLKPWIFQKILLDFRDPQKEP